MPLEHVSSRYHNKKPAFVGLQKSWLAATNELPKKSRGKQKQPSKIIVVEVDENLPSLNQLRREAPPFER
jgi:hypothetical protein